MKKIKVLVVDDSALMRKMIPRILHSDPELEVVGTAMDGLYALNKIVKLRPDVITLDVSMPRMNGIETLRYIVRDYGIPTVIVSSLTKKDADLTFRALEIGAFDFVAKPQDAISVHIAEIGSELIEKVKAAYRNPIVRLKLRGIQPVTKEKEKRPARSRKERAVKVLAIGASTGGPNALSYLLPRFPRDFPAALVIVQHMPEGFTEMFASRLDTLCNLDVKEARKGDLIIPGRALIAPGNMHLKVSRMALGTIAILSDSASENGHRPSVDVLFRSVASVYGSDAAGLIMTGMGTDGALGIGEIKRRGGLTVAQDEESCVVFGMPKAALERDDVRCTVPLDEMGDFFIDHFSGKEADYGTVSC